MKKRTICLSVIALLLLMSFCGCAKQGSTYEDYVGLVTEMPEFHSTDLDGNEVDNSIFEKADVTVVNVWGTFCGPCINEMPALADWSKDLPENVQIIGIVIDAASADSAEFEKAKQLMEKNGISYTNIIAADQFTDGFLDSIAGVPTTFFVGPDGKCLADEVIGADVEAYKRTVEGLL